MYWLIHKLIEDRKQRELEAYTESIVNKTIEACEKKIEANQSRPMNDFFIQSRHMETFYKNALIDYQNSPSTDKDIYLKHLGDEMYKLYNISPEALAKKVMDEKQKD